MTLRMRTFLSLVFLASASTLAVGQSPEGNQESSILAALFRNSDVELTNARHCEGVGISESGHTVGDYISDFWRFHTARDGQNWLEITATPRSNGDVLAKVMIYRKSKEANWGWGVSFVMLANGQVDRLSFACLGSG